MEDERKIKKIIRKTKKMLNKQITEEVKEELLESFKIPNLNIVGARNGKFPIKFITAQLLPFAIRKGTTFLRRKLKVKGVTLYVMIDSTLKKEDIFQFFESEAVKKYVSRSTKSFEETLPLPTIEEGFPLYLKLVSMIDEKKKDKDGDYYVDVSLNELRQDGIKKYESIIYQLVSLHSVSIRVWVKNEERMILKAPQLLITGLETLKEKPNSTKPYLRVHINPHLVPYIGVSYSFIPKSLFKLPGTAIAIFTKLKFIPSKTIQFEEEKLFEMIGLEDKIFNNRITVKNALESLKQNGFIADYKYSNHTFKIEKKEDVKALSTPSGKITFNAEEACFEGIDEEKIEEWKKKYPFLNIEEELRMMEAWLTANPDHKVRNYKRFIENWFIKDYNRLIKNRKGSYIPMSDNHDEFTGESKDAGEW